MKKQGVSTLRQPLLVALVGGTGFVGRAASAALRGRGYKVRLVARHRPAKLAAGEEFMTADTADQAALLTALAGCEVVVHLVGMLAERGTTFEEVVHQGASRMAQAARLAGVRQMVYVSALGADAAVQSAYARAKVQAEGAVRAVFAQAVILRPSLVIGQGGGFSRQVDLLTRYAPVMVLPGMGRTQFQPIALEALGEQIAEACLNPAWAGRTVEAAGPAVLSFRQLVEEELAKLGRRRVLLPLPWSLTWLVAYAMVALDRLTSYRLLPEWLLVTPDQVRLLHQDNIATPNS